MSPIKTIVLGIVFAVNQSPRPRYEDWRIGLSHDPNQRFIQVDKPVNFRTWEADSLSEALAVEYHFLKTHGMQGDTSGDLEEGKPIWVYVW